MPPPLLLSLLPFALLPLAPPLPLASPRVLMPQKSLTQLCWSSLSVEVGVSVLTALDAPADASDAAEVAVSSD